MSKLHHMLPQSNRTGLDRLSAAVSAMRAMNIFLHATESLYVSTNFDPYLKLLDKILLTTSNYNSS